MISDVEFGKLGWEGRGKTRYNHGTGLLLRSLTFSSFKAVYSLTLMLRHVKCGQVYSLETGVILPYYQIYHLNNIHYVYHENNSRSLLGYLLQQQADLLTLLPWKLSLMCFGYRGNKRETLFVLSTIYFKIKSTHYVFAQHHSELPRCFLQISEKRTQVSHLKKNCKKKNRVFLVM